MSFTDKKLSEVYKDILHTNNSNTGISSTVKTITCGDGDTTALVLSNRNVRVDPASDTTSTFLVRDADGNVLAAVDSTNDLVKLGIGQHTANTQYAYFNIGQTESSGFSANTHYGLSYQHANYSSAITGIVSFGTGTDPATSFTTADSNNARG